MQERGFDKNEGVKAIKQSFGLIAWVPFMNVKCPRGHYDVQVLSSQETKEIKLGDDLRCTKCDAKGLVGETRNKWTNE